MKVYACPPVPVFYRSAKGEESELRELRGREVCCRCRGPACAARRRGRARRSGRSALLGGELAQLLRPSHPDPIEHDAVRPGAESGLRQESGESHRP